MIQSILDYLSTLIHSPAYRPWSIVIELLLIGIVVYSVLRFLHGTRGARLLQGFLVLLVVGFLVVRVVSEELNLERITVLYEPFMWTVLLTTLIVFQPELRRGLMRLGGAGLVRAQRSDIDRIARPIATACGQLSKTKIGALIAIERDIGLSGLIEQGVKLDARLTPELIHTVFWPGSALHDLGMIVQNGRIAAAGCQFPLADSESIERSIGSRHRAAVGLSLDSDAVVVIVSEETGSISIAERGRLYRHIPPDALFGTLRRHLASPRGMNRRRADTPKAASVSIGQEGDVSAQTESTPEAQEDANHKATKASPL